MTQMTIDEQIEQIAEEWGHYTITAKSAVTVVIHAHVVEIAEGFRTLAVHTVMNGWDATMYIPYDDIVSIESSDSPI